MRLGLDAKLYLDTSATPATPTWSLIGNCKDVTLNLETSEADVTTRSSNGWKASAPTLKDASVDFTMLWDPADTNFTKLKTAFITRGSVFMAVMDGEIATPGSQGLIAMMMVSKFTRNEPLVEAMTADVTVKPTYYPAIAPDWELVS